MKIYIILSELIIIVALCSSAAGQSLKLNIRMVPGIWISEGNGSVDIEFTTNVDQVSGWSFLATVKATNNPFFYADATATNAQARFYRATLSATSTNPPTANPDPAHLVWIAPGTFTMGSPSTEQDRTLAEGPQTQVTLSRGFWMAKYETTQEEYQSVMNTGSILGDTNSPKVAVGWDAANVYCSNLTTSERTAGRVPSGYAYRLPTEAEWEYACRAGTTTRFSYGDDLGYALLGDYSWYALNASNTMRTIGQKKPNPWGLYDMHGNASEWCLDWFANYQGGSATDPQGPNVGLGRVIRGGGVLSGNSAALCRSAYRTYLNHDFYSSSLVGFRIVLAPAQ
jgi:formylglycine-generating enzyme required for sulfatase activity